MQANTSRKLAQVEEQLNQASNRVAEYEVTISSLQANKSKLQSENNDLSNQLADAESKNGSLSKNNANLLSQVEELKSELQMEITVSHQQNQINTKSMNDKLSWWTEDSSSDKTII